MTRALNAAVLLLFLGFAAFQPLHYALWADEHHNLKHVSHHINFFAAAVLAAYLFYETGREER